ncbi:fimbrial protein [Escherichia albertii]|uniref:fimbrial protein n=1 Tax=Escherichia albertii TaxID=208962 RepID=UPI00211A3DC7|nr:fimbrial protein [Escherichia albertii]MCQ8915694.1 fimbrial protein [Escherichia albertii]MCQ8925091.1 fimbrial protein [Escherichia albertii]MCQ8946024.1 fimbrial protein [Escherichia albertii]MCQ8960727.1 fimbrial protein [Escherichia albertii]MCQ8969757.1 fimbrial protein [Escherichia albertii]
MRGAFLPIAAALLLTSATVWADSKTVNMELRVLVDAPPPCSIKGSAVNFGDVLIKSINGSNYLKPVGYTLNCGARKFDDLRMQLRGTTATINGQTVVATGIDGFGIRVQSVSDHSLFAVGYDNWTPFNFANQPKLEAVPVKQSGVQLTASAFSATVTMVVDYQ